MKTKAEIVQKLLDEKKIDAEEAVILLMGEKEYIFLNNNPYPTTWPIYPSWTITVGTGTLNCSTSSANSTFNIKGGLS